MPEPRNGTGSHDHVAGANRPHQRVTTPLADAVDAVASRDIVSFHALPISQGRSVTTSTLSDRFTRLYGANALRSEVSYSGPMLDSFFRPCGPLRDAQELAAHAFGSDATFFLSTGTSAANRIALSAMTSPGDRIIVDRSCHQSIHFALSNQDAVEYCRMRQCCAECKRSIADLHDLLNRVRRSAQHGEPFQTVVLSAASYDGVRYDLPRILTEIYDSTPSATVIVDEAWAGIHCFHPRLRRYSALEAAADVRSRRATGAPSLIVTHSAHKSMSALRQGSFLHVVGDPDVIGRIDSALFGQHTTSPSFPILASLDLARAQAEIEGEQLVDRSIALADELRGAVQDDPNLSMYRVLRPCDYLSDSGNFVTADPTKVLLDLSGVGVSPVRFRQVLFDEHSIYVSRECGNSVLLNIHIGIDPTGLRRLLEALRAVQRSQKSSLDELETGPCRQFIIAYPPGIPIIVPGESLKQDTIDELRVLRRTGSEIFTVPS